MTIWKVIAIYTANIGNSNLCNVSRVYVVLLINMSSTDVKLSPVSMQISTSPITIAAIRTNVVLHAK